MIECTSCYLIRGERPVDILLGYKKTGFGSGYYAGIGGKVMPDEGISAAAIRELKEETSIRAQEEDLIPKGRIDFHFPNSPAWDLRMHVYLINNWAGEPAESREIIPTWFPIREIPYDRMWADAMHWMPYVLQNMDIDMVFTFAADNKSLSGIQFAPGTPIRPPGSFQVTT